MFAVGDNGPRSDGSLTIQDCVLRVLAAKSRNTTHSTSVLIWVIQKELAMFICLSYSDMTELDQKIWSNLSIKKRVDKDSKIMDRLVARKAYTKLMREQRGREFVLSRGA